MENSLQRKVPGDREQRKIGQKPYYRQGQRCEITVGLRKAKVTVIGATKAGDGVVVRLRQQYDRQLNRRESQELDVLSTRLRRYGKERQEGRFLSTLERDEEERMLERVKQLTERGPVKMTRTFAIAREAIKSTQKEKPKRKQTSITEKRKLQKKQLLSQIASKLRDGVNPKRLKRELKRTRFVNIKIENLK